MQVPVDIRFRHVEPSEPLEAIIREHVEALEVQHERLTSCHVTVDRVGASRGPGRAHHRQGKGAHYRVSIHVMMPGTELFVGRDPPEHTNFEDPFAAVNEAFDNLKRQLRDLKHPPKGGLRITSAVQ